MYGPSIQQLIMTGLSQKQLDLVGWHSVVPEAHTEQVVFYFRTVGAFIEEQTDFYPRGLANGSFVQFFLLLFVNDMRMKQIVNAYFLFLVQIALRTVGKVGIKVHTAQPFQVGFNCGEQRPVSLMGLFEFDSEQICEAQILNRWTSTFFWNIQPRPTGTQEYNICS